MAQQRRLPALVLTLAAASQARADNGSLTVTPDGRARPRLDVRVVYDLSWDAGGRNSVSRPAMTSSIS